MEANQLTRNDQRVTNRDRKLALLQHVDKLKKRLRHEENMRRAMERAFTRPLGTLPRLPPYLPPRTLELLAEVAVLEEEVVRLEEQVVLFRKGLYQEAVSISSSMSKVTPSICVAGGVEAADLAQAQVCAPESAAKPCAEDGRRKDIPSCSRSSPAKSKQCSQKLTNESSKTETNLEHSRMQIECENNSQENDTVVKGVSYKVEPNLGDDRPNFISENLAKCLMSLFLRMIRRKSRTASGELPSSSALSTHSNVEEAAIQDPYGICSGYGKRDIGPYKHLRQIDAKTFHPKQTSSSFFLLRRLNILLEKLVSVKLQGLVHQQKLAFWINIYNSCVMKAFLERGVPETPEAITALMHKATVNVGGHLLSARTIEHVILRLPHHCKYTFSDAARDDGTTARTIFGLELSESLVTFALSRGSWSSPAVRVYTSSQVENELEVAKREYLQAAVGISSNRKLLIPKLLDLYLLDFAKDAESLLDWVCLQLPINLRKEAIKCLEKRGENEPPSQFVQVMPYDFRFRYLFRT